MAFSYGLACVRSTRTPNQDRMDDFSACGGGAYRHGSYL